MEQGLISLLLAISANFALFIVFALVKPVCNYKKQKVWKAMFLISLLLTVVELSSNWPEIKMAQLGIIITLLAFSGIIFVSIGFLGVSKIFEDKVKSGLHIMTITSTEGDCVVGKFHAYGQDLEAFICNESLKNRIINLDENYCVRVMTWTDDGIWVEII